MESGLLRKLGSLKSPDESTMEVRINKEALKLYWEKLLNFLRTT
jgi:hypothetical protein